MRKFLKFSVATLAALVLPFAVNIAKAETTHAKWNKSTSKGRAFIVGEHWDVNRDCSVRAFPTAKVVSAPKHGKAKVGRGNIKMSSKLAKDPYYKCKSKTISGTTVKYTPAPGFTGEDTLKLRVSFSTGDVHVIDIVVTVR